jgi:hypothetical protein
VWDKLLADHGVATTFHGEAQSPATYLAEGAREWEEYIRPHLTPGCDQVLEWGAGAGRITRHAARDCGALYAWEPAEGPRALLLDVSNDLVGLCIHPGYQIVQTMTDELMDRLPDRCITDCFCYNVVHHMTYDDIYDMLVYVDRVLAIGGRLLFNFVTFDSDAAAELMSKKEGSFPAYVWHGEQIGGMVADLVGGMSLEYEWIERDLGGRVFQLWERES